MFEEVLLVIGIVGILVYALSFGSAFEIVSDVYSVDSFSLGQVGEDVVGVDYDSRYVMPTDSGGYFESADVYGEIKKFPDDILLVETIIPSGGGGGGGGASVSGSGVAEEFECVRNEDCEEKYSCVDNFCILVYELKILDFESPGRLGENFDFRFFVRRFLNVSGDVKTTYWMQDDNGNIAGYGSDDLFLSENEGRTSVGNFVLNEKVRDGDYSFFVRVDDYNISLIESVPVSLRIVGDSVYIKRKVNVPIVIALSFVVVTSLFLIIMFNDKLIALWYWFKRRYLDNSVFRVKDYFWRIFHEKR